MTRHIRIGTRGSQLALTQTELFKKALQKAVPNGELELETVIIKTSGDWSPSHGETRLSEVAGGKGQFAKEIEEAMLDGRIDCAVHSVKDMDSHATDGLLLNHFLPREDVRDAFISEKYVRFDDLPEGAVLGTSSVRRQAMALALRPDLKIVPLRGNVPTRLEKVKAGQVDATFLAMAGLNRLELISHCKHPMEIEQMLPGAGQGAVGIQCRESDDELITLLEKINCEKTRLAVQAERAALAVLDGSCHTPIGAYAEIANSEVWLRVCVCALDGSQSWDDETRGDTTDTEGLGQEVAERLKAKIPASYLS
jgi:hydroxymethylbilane synthase